MWALTSRRAKRTSGLEEISPGGKIDFFNTIGTVGVAVQVRDFRLTLDRRKASTVRYPPFDGVM
jgi:hypothetical protein